MAKYVLKRLLYIVLVAFVVSFIMYLIYNLIPGDPARLLLEPQRMELEKQGVYEQTYLQLRKTMGLDDPILLRYLRWVGLAPLNGVYSGMLQGDFGDSIRYSLPAIEVIKTPMKVTVSINLIATVLALGITYPLGIFCAVKKGSKRDLGVQVGTIIGYSLPTFLIAVIFIWLFCVVFPVFPVSGMSTPGAGYTGVQKFLDQAYYLALPLIVMTFCSLGGMTRYVRSAMTEALAMDCIKTARAKGLQEKSVVYSHAFRNALIPIITLTIGWFLSIFSGSLMIEQTFSISGVGKLLIDSLNNKDYEVALCLQMFYVIIGLLGNLIIDIAYGLVDPRVRINK